jgi:hypothetical protein
MKNVSFILYATTTFSAVIPFYPEFSDRPDSAQVKSIKTDEIYYTVKYSYNNDGYLTSEQYFDKGQLTGSVESHFLKSGDTVKCTYVMTEEPDNQYVDMYIFDKTGRVIGYKGYDGSYLYDDEIIAYNQENKISKTITATTSLASEMGDSAVYRYQNGRITTVDIYGDRGSKWSYSAYHTDDAGRVIRSTEYSCESSCTADTEYMVYFYEDTPVRFVKPQNARSDSYEISLSNNNILVRMQNGKTRISDIRIFDLEGKCIKKVSSVDQNSMLLSSEGITGRQVFFQLHTNGGNFNVPVFMIK